MDFSASAPSLAGRHPPLRAIAVVALVLLALVVGAIVAGGNPRRLPAPYGSAANGLIVYAAPEGEAWKKTPDFIVPKGDIVTVDPVTGVSRTLVGGPPVDGYPVPSLDGTRVAFVRDVAGGRQLFVVDIRDGDPKPLTNDPLPTISDAEWSPDGASIAFTSAHGEQSDLWIASSDGSGAERIDLHREISVVLPHWRPQDGREILLVGSVIRSPGFLPTDGYRSLWGGSDDPTGTGIGLFVVRRDGTGLRPITPTTGGGFDYGHVAWTPDGDRIVTQRAEAGLLKVRVLTADGAEARTIQPTIGAETVQPIVSPDGSKVAYADLTSSESWQVRVAPIDSSGEPVAVGEHFVGGAATFRWSPDGRTIIVTHHYYKETWLLDVNGAPPSRASWTDPGYPAWQRLAR